MNAPKWYTLAPMDVGAMKRELADYERKFGCPSSRLHEAFRGSRVETEDELQWAMLYTELLTLAEQGNYPFTVGTLMGSVR